MIVKKCFIFCLLACLVSMVFLWRGPTARAAEDMEQEIWEKSGAGELYDGLDQETQELLGQAGVDGVESAGDGTGLFSLVSGLVREKVTGPAKALAALAAVILLCRLAGCLGGGEIDGTLSFAGALACAAVAALPLLEVIRAAQKAVESACTFLLASVPVCGALMAASGSPAAGASYSFLTLAAGNVIPVLSSMVVFPMLHAFLALALASSVSQVKLDKLAGSLYGFAKWLLVLAVTLFSGVLSVQTALNAQTDAVTNKTVKVLASTAVPIVGSAFGDAVSAIRNSVHLVKSGAGAFGILAALCIFAPPAVEATLWVVVCSIGQVLGDLFETPKLSAFLGMCVSAAKMILAVLISVCVVSVVSAAVILFVKGG